MKCSECSWQRPEPSPPVKRFALYLDAALVAIVAILGLVVLSDSMRQWYGYLIQKRPFTSSEIVVMAGGGSAGNLHATVITGRRRLPAAARHRLLLNGNRAEV